MNQIYGSNVWQGITYNAMQSVGETRVDFTWHRQKRQKRSGLANKQMSQPHTRQTTTQQIVSFEGRLQTLQCQNNEINAHLPYC